MPSLSSRSIALFVAGLASACASPGPASAPIVAVPVAAASVAPAPSLPPPPPKVVTEVPVPSGACIVEADAPKDAMKRLGLFAVYVGEVKVASIDSLGTVGHARLAFAEGTEATAGVAVDASIASVRGATPNGDMLHLYPRTRVARAGWLSYREIHVASVRAAEIEPVTDLPEWLVPTADFTAKPFFVSCAELTPFGSRESLASDASLTGAHVALEDESGKKVATLEPPKEGLPVVMGRSVKGRTQISFEAGSLATAEGWVATRHVKKSNWGGIGYGTGSGRGRSTHVLTCDADVPLHLRAGDATYAFGLLHPHQAVEGKPDEHGSFVVTQLGGSGKPWPFVPAAHLRSCRVSSR